MNYRVDDIISNILKRRVFAHVLFWTLFLLFSIIYALGFGQPIMISLILKSILLPFQILATYIFIYFQLPLIYKKQYFLFAVSFLLIAYAIITLIHINNDFGPGLLLKSWHEPHTLIHIIKAKSMFFNYAVDIYVLVFGVTAVKLVKDQFSARSQIQKIEAQNSRSEYNYLQSKVQPEFLLRSLKLIENKSINFDKDTPEVIANLSDVLDFSLYKSKSDHVSISEELEQFNTYLKIYVEGSEKIKELDNKNSDLKQPARIVPLTLVNVIKSLLNNADHRNITIDLLKISHELKDEQFLLNINLEGVDGKWLYKEEELTKLLNVNYEAKNQVYINQISDIIEVRIKLQL